MIIKISLLPFRAKIIGIVLLIISLLTAYLYFSAGKPDVFNIKTFALMSVYLKKQTFTVIQTNILDELAAISFIVGIVLLTFSKEKNEKPNYPELRGKAFRHSMFITLTIWILFFLLIYGMLIFLFSASVLIMFFIIYNLLYYAYKIKSKFGQYYAGSLIIM